MPCFPGSLSGVPEVVEFFVVAEHIHGFPESCMLVGMHFSVGSQVLQRLLFKGYVIPTGRNIVEHFRFANEESYVNPSAVTIRFFMEGIYPSVGRVNVDSSKFSGLNTDIEMAAPFSRCTSMVFAMSISLTPSP